MVRDFALDDLQSHRGMAHTARTGTPRLALDLRGFMAMDFDLLHPRGGDQWDNPRYRLILFAFEALTAGYAWTWWRAHRDPWLPRIAAVEALAVLIFLQWYLSRYYHWGGQIPFFLMIGLIVLVSAAILGGGWLWDRRAASKSRLTRS